MPWHDEAPWERKWRRKKNAEPPRIAEIVRQCRAGKLSLDGAIVAAYLAGLDDRAAIEDERAAAEHKELAT